MRINPENNIDRHNYKISNDRTQNIKEENKKENHSVTFEKRSKNKNTSVEDNSFFDESEVIKKKANTLINDFSVEKESAEILHRTADNIKRFSEYEYKSAKEVLDETGTLVKNERKKRTVNGIVYRREKKKRFGGGIEIIDDANKKITRKIYKDRNETIITTYDKNDCCCIYSFNEKGVLKSYLEDVKENEKGHSAEVKFTYENGKVATAEKKYEYFLSGDETAKSYYIFDEKYVTEAYINYKKTNNSTQTVTSNFYLTYKNEYPYQFYKSYEATNELTESYKEKYTYEVNDYITYLKEYINEDYIYKFEFNKLSTVNINEKNDKKKILEKIDEDENYPPFQGDTFE